MAQESPSYSIRDVVHDGYSTVVFRAVRNDDRRPIVWDLFAFQHDRIQQAAYALIERADVDALHLGIGRRLLAHADERSLEDHLFDVVNLLDTGRALITEAAERARLADLNVLAGSKAKASTAYTSARHYYHTAIELLGEGAWERRYEMALTSHMGHAECAYLSGDFEVAEAAFRHIIAKARSKLDKSKSYNLLLKLCQVSGRYADGVPLGLEALQMYGVTTWAGICPANFENKRALVAAELARVTGRPHDAEPMYEKAIAAAASSGFTPYEALACELAGRFYRDGSFTTIASSYLRDARAAYLRWGADGKVRQLDRLFPPLVERGPLTPSATFAARPEQLDLLSVVKASQMISSEIVFDKLICTLLDVVIAQAAAQRASLILCRNGELLIEAEARVGDAGVRTQLVEPTPVSSSSLVPASVVNYARRTKEHVIVDDATGTHHFSADPYFRHARPRSLLCLPIVRQGEVIALLELENDLIGGAFTPERLAVLELLASQVAISLENALFVAREHDARAAAEAAERRSALLAEASAVLAESLDDEAPTSRVVRLLVRFPADACVLDVVGGEGQSRRSIAVHANPVEQPLLDEISRRYPLRPGGPQPSARVLASGQPLVLAELPPTYGTDEEHVRLVRRLRIGRLLCVPLLARGKALGVLSLARERGRPAFDAAERELAKEIAHRLAIAMENARLFRQTQDAVRTRDDFLSIASHELRTPMTSLQLSLSVLLRAGATPGKAIDATLVRLLELSKRQGDRLERLVADLLDATRIESGKLPLEVAEMDLGALVREVAARFEPDLQRARCPLSLRVSGSVIGRWDRSRLDQVVSNLLANAVKFGEGQPIEIRVEADANVARLTVADRGIGIEPERQPHIFERFECAVSVQHHGGLGLGLYITHRLVQAHGGTIVVDSRLGQGTTFRVELPFAGPATSSVRDIAFAAR